MIKNFVYLDEEKMYSLSSQIFEGITEYILSESTSESQKSESQKGDIGSGRILGDILKQADRQSEKKFLHDYSCFDISLSLIILRLNSPSDHNQRIEYNMDNCY